MADEIQGDRFPDLAAFHGITEARDTLQVLNRAYKPWIETFITLSQTSFPPILEPNEPHCGRYEMSLRDDYSDAELPVRAFVIKNRRTGTTKMFDLPVEGVEFVGPDYFTDIRDGAIRFRTSSPSTASGFATRAFNPTTDMLLLTTLIEMKATALRKRHQSMPTRFPDIPEPT